jgi:GTP-binding protein HflX
MTDTVGFIRKLPHDLVAPFRSTLSEAVEADLVLHVVDVSHPAWEEHLRVGDEVLEGLGVVRENELIVLNKTDLVAGLVPTAPNGRGAARVSAVTGKGVAALGAAVRQRLLTAKGVAMLQVPLADAEAVQRALGLPHQLARRYRRETLELALRADRWRLAEAGLEEYLISDWPDGGS